MLEDYFISVDDLDHETLLSYWRWLVGNKNISIIAAAAVVVSVKGLESLGKLGTRGKVDVDVVVHGGGQRGGGAAGADPAAANQAAALRHLRDFVQLRRQTMHASLAKPYFRSAVDMLMILAELARR